MLAIHWSLILQAWFSGKLDLAQEEINQELLQKSLYSIQITMRGLVKSSSDVDGLPPPLDCYYSFKRPFFHTKSNYYLNNEAAELEL